MKSKHLHLVLLAIAIAGTTNSFAQTLVDLTGTSLTWSSALGSTSGYPTQQGSTGINATANLGSGLTLSVTSTHLGTAAPYAQDGSKKGNLNVLNGTDPGDSTTLTVSPYGTFTGNPSVVSNQMTGFTFSGTSEGQDGNSATSMANYLRYDFMFNQPVYLSNLTITDIDALRITYSGLAGKTFTVFEDAVALETWSGATTGALGTGIMLAPTYGSNLTEVTNHGITYVKAEAALGLVDSSNTANHAVYSSSNPVYGFSVYYFDDLNNTDNVNWNGGMTIGLENFTVTAVPEPSALALCAIGGLAFFRRRRG